MRLKASILMLLAFAPVLASAKPRPTTGPRVRQQVIRDRAPKVRLRTPQVHPRS